MSSPESAPAPATRKERRTEPTEHRMHGDIDQAETEPTIEQQEDTPDELLAVEQILSPDAEEQQSQLELFGDLHERFEDAYGRIHDDVYNEKYKALKRDGATDAKADKSARRYIDTEARQNIVAKAHEAVKEDLLSYASAFVEPGLDEDAEREQFAHVSGVLEQGMTAPREDVEAWYKGKLEQLDGVESAAVEDDSGHAQAEVKTEDHEPEDEELDDMDTRTRWQRVKDAPGLLYNRLLISRNESLTPEQNERRSERRKKIIIGAQAVAAAGATAGMAYLAYKGISSSGGGGNGQHIIDNVPTPDGHGPSPGPGDIESPQSQPENIGDYFSGSKGTTEFNEAGLEDFNDWADGYRVKSGDTIWGLSEQYLEEHGINDPSEYQIDAVKDQVLAEFKDEGIVGENGWLYTGDTLHTDFDVDAAPDGGAGVNGGEQSYDGGNDTTPEDGGNISNNSVEAAQQGADAAIGVDSVGGEGTADTVTVEQVANSAALENASFIEGGMGGRELLQKIGVAPEEWNNLVKEVNLPKLQPNAFSWHSNEVWLNANSTISDNTWSTIVEHLPQADRSRLLGKS